MVKELKADFAKKMYDRYYGVGEMVSLSIFYLFPSLNKVTWVAFDKLQDKQTIHSRGACDTANLLFPPLLKTHEPNLKPVPKKPNASSSGNKKKGVEPTIEVSNSNPFDVLNSVDNVEFGTNRATTNLVNNGATSSGPSFMNIDNDGEFASNTPIGAKIDKIEQQICE
ncbi:hypothetical protein Tco_1288551, partial [Tanacetum coccineum]